MDLLTYKTYSATAEFDADSETFHGRVLGIRDVVTFQGTSVAELKQAFQDSVDDYLDFCKSRGEKPDKPYSGKFVLRIAPALHRNLSEYAEQHGQSLNSVVETLIANNITTPATSKRTTKSRRKA
ncbi:type II toxin-antitoxin system HicB family antitoxin [Lacunimicrobium album]